MSDAHNGPSSFPAAPGAYGNMTDTQLRQAINHITTAAQATYASPAPRPADPKGISPLIDFEHTLSNFHLASVHEKCPYMVGCVHATPQNACFGSQEYPCSAGTGSQCLCAYNPLHPSHLPNSLACVYPCCSPKPPSTSFAQCPPSAPV